MREHRYCFLPRNKDGDLNIVGYGYETFEKRQNFSPLHIINHYSIHYVIKGEGTLLIQDKTYPLKKGAMFLCPKGVPMAYHTSKVNPYTYFWLNFQGNKAEEILLAFNLSKENPVIYPEQVEKIKNAFFDLVWENDKTSEYLALSTLYKIAYLTQNDNTQLVTPAKLYCEKIIEFIKPNYKSIDLKISDIATYLHITPQYMSKIFKEERGESVVSYLISYRMNVARELLLSGLTVSEASLESGYLDLSNFSKTYKRVFGFPPSETNVKYY